MDERAREYRATLDAVLRILNEHDLAGLGPGQPDGTPPEEYELEAAPIVAALLDRGGVERAEVSQIWAHWFNDDLSWLPADRWAALLAELNGARRSGQDPQPR